MTNLLAAAGSLIDSFKLSLGESITVSDGGYSCSLHAIIIGEERVVQDVDQSFVKWVAKAFHITAADLVLNGQQKTPVPGMKITLSNGDVYKVTEPPGDGHCYDELAGGVRLVLRAIQEK